MPLRRHISGRQQQNLECEQRPVKLGANFRSERPGEIDAMNFRGEAMHAGLRLD
jgi:hypothetical protein